MLIRSTALLSLLGSAAVAFQPLVPAHNTHAPRQPQSALAMSYLDSLSEPHHQYSPPTYAVSAIPAAPVRQEGATVPADQANAAVGLHHAPLEYFALDKLVSKGPRETADWGQPYDATRKLADDGMLRAGSWFCSEGGWPSPNPKAHTEIFYMVDGNGCLLDADGGKHYFGPGDTVIIPKGHTGRWDVFKPIHKVWAVNAHDRIEETSNPIRVQVDHYCNLAPQYLTPNAGYDPLYRSESSVISYQTFYDVGPTKVGVWACSPGSIPVANGAKSFFHLLEGVMFVTNSATGESKRCVAGDTVMLPENWFGYIDVIEPAKKLWTTVE